MWQTSSPLTPVLAEKKMGKKKDENMAGLQAEALEKAHCSHSKTSI